MKALLDTLEVRAIEFLTILYSEEKWWTEKELSEIVGCSPDTTYRMIGYLKQFALTQTNVFEVITQKNKGIFLKTTTVHSIGEIECQYIMGTLGFKIMDKVFQSDELVIDDLAEMFHVSNSTIYRKLKSIKQFLELNNLSFNMSKLRVEGEEHLIREFFYRMYWSVIKGNNWPFQQSSFDDWLKIYEKKITFIGLNLTSIERLQFFYRLSINLVRHNGGNFLVEGPDKALIDPFHEKYAADIKHFMPDNIPSHYFTNEVTFLSLILVSNPIFEEKYGDYQVKVIWHEERKTLPYEFSINLLRSIRKEYNNIDFGNTMRVLYKLLCTSLYAIIFSPLKIHYTDTRVFINKFAEENPHFYATIQRIVAAESAKMGKDVPDMDKEYLLYTILLIFSDSVNIGELEERLYVKLICNIEPLSESYLKQLLENTTHSRLVIHTSTTSDPLVNEYDLFLTDMAIKQIGHVPAKNEYIWDFPPTERDWNNIVTLLDRTSVANQTNGLAI